MKTNETEQRVYYADTDHGGVVYYSNYLRWFEIGRTELLRGTGITYNDVENYGIHLPLIEEGVKFLKPAYYDDVLTIITKLEWLKRVRVRFTYEIWRNEEKLATGYTEHVFTDVKLRPTRPPKELQRIINKLGDTSNDIPDKRINL